MKVVRFILLLIHIPIILVLLAGLLNAYISPKTFGLLNLISLAFPVLMIINLLLCLFWIVSWKKRAAIFLALSIFLITPTRRWINYTAESKESADLKLLIFNTKNGSLGLEDVIDYINNQK